MVTYAGSLNPTRRSSYEELLLLYVVFVNSGVSTQVVELPSQQRVRLRVTASRR